MGFFSKKKAEVVEEDTDPDFLKGPTRLRIMRCLRQRYAPTVLDCINVSPGDKHDETDFQVVVVSEDFKSSPRISLPYLKRIQMIISTVADEFGEPLEFKISVQAALTKEEYAGEATVPAQPLQFPIGVIK